VTQRQAAPAELSDFLAGRLTAVWGTEARVTDLHRLTGGASRETWEFSAGPTDGGPTADGQPTRRLILRRDPPGADRPGDMAREAEAIRAAEAAGVPVAPVLDHGRSYLVSEFVEGETLARRLLRDERYAQVRSGLAAECGRTLARIHSVPAEALPPPGPDPLDAVTEDYRALDEPLPPVEIALRWLREHRPPPVPDRLVHGDFRNGNLLVHHEDGLRAVLDWELVHRGDPAQDLGWLCVKAWRFGTEPAVGGFGSREQLFDGYQEVAGVRPDPDRVHWWEVYGTTWWAVGCRRMAEGHLSGATRSVELAAIGRRVCEQEYDLLLALGLGTADAPAPEPVPSPSPGLHGRPTAAELLTAVTEFLRAEVLPATEGQVNFHTRVAANVLDTVTRELTLGPAQEAAHRTRLAALGHPDQNAFAAALRDGKADPADPAVLEAVRESVAARLRVANPRYR
jgi:aminoglycoside phosphotransferase (APT) family kinase protein